MGGHNNVCGRIESRIDREFEVQPFYEPFPGGRMDLHEAHGILGGKGKRCERALFPHHGEYQRHWEVQFFRLLNRHFGNIKTLTQTDTLTP